ncbi:class II histone deacetylase [Roseovarius arcticus]|uniref:class II histone deacetylase n=1 Tax=Roseovarius arcticus TaxID=2547404 RepID=UPI0011109A12|nr:class II histone deacetylase [Roseovarius arcticus]
MQFHTNTKCARRTGWVTSELYYWHDTQNYCGFFEPSMTVQPGMHFENPETKRRFHGLVEALDLAPHLHALRPHSASDESIRMVHPQSHIDHIAKVCASGGGDFGEMTPGGPATLDIARLAVGGVIDAVDKVVAGEWDNAYVLCRPPGHHAEPEWSRGFCIFANAALGVKHAQQAHGIKRVATIDWDVHHGNGSETIFYDDPSVLTISLHQNRLYPPDSGDYTDTGRDGGEGANLNIPLPPGSGSGAYRTAFEELVIPALEAFKPEMIFVPSGFDSCALDPLGMQMLASGDYAWMTARLMEVADKHAKGRIIMTHEGGYSAVYVPYCGLATLEALSGADTTFEDPFAAIVAAYGGQELSGDQKQVIDNVKKSFFKTVRSTVESET